MTESPDFPKSIRIGWMDYSVEEWCPRDAAGAQRYGEANHAAKNIRVDTSFGPIQSADTMLHEILHALWRHANIDQVDDPSEEFLVGAIASNLTQVWRDNPDFVNWYTWATGLKSKAA